MSSAFPFKVARCLKKRKKCKPTHTRTQMHTHTQNCVLSHKYMQIPFSHLKLPLLSLPLSTCSWTEAETCVPVLHGVWTQHRAWAHLRLINKIRARARTSLSVISDPPVIGWWWLPMRIIVAVAHSTDWEDRWAAPEVPAALEQTELRDRFNVSP